jgi:hypothetical protein
MLKANAELRHSLYPAGEAARLTPGIRSLPALADPVKLEAGLRRSPNFNQVRSLQQLGALPLDEKRRTAVLVPQSDSRYWTILKRPNGCAFSGFVVPSLTGMAMIDGMPAAECRLSPYYGLSLFERRTRPQSPSEIEPGHACRRATEKGFRRVMLLRFDAEGRAMPEVTECVPAA